MIFIMMTLMSVSGAHGRCYNETRMGRNATTLQRLTLAANVMASLSSIMVSLMFCCCCYFSKLTKMQQIASCVVVFAIHLLLQKAGYIPTVAQRQKERDFYKF